MDFTEQFQKDIEQNNIGGSGGDWFKPKEGDNKIRILETPIINVSRYKYGVCYEGAEYCKKENLGPKDSLSYKWLTWIIDRTDGKVKLYNLPFSVTKSITALKANGEYTFSDFPMPYDVTINAKGAGTKEVEYSVLPSRKETPVTAEELAELEKQTTVDEVIEAMKDKARKEHGDGSTSDSREDTREVPAIAYPEGEPNPEDIPF